MHELALCASIADIVRTRAAGRHVETVRLRIGELRQVVPQTLDWCWALVVESTPLDGSQLEIERVPALLHCTACGREHLLGVEIDFACPGCSAVATTVVAGEEFLVTSIDVVADDAGVVAP